MDILVLGASYGSLFATKCLMAGHNVTLICTPRTAELINSKGTEVRIKLRGEDQHRSICSRDYKGSCTAVTPDSSHPYSYDLIVLAMQEPQYSQPEVKALMQRIARSGRPVLSIMNHPPLAYLRRIHKLAHVDLSNCFTEASVWDDFDPALVVCVVQIRKHLDRLKRQATYYTLGYPQTLKQRHLVTEPIPTCCDN